MSVLHSEQQSIVPVKGVYQHQKVPFFILDSVHYQCLLVSMCQLALGYKCLTANSEVPSQISVGALLLGFVLLQTHNRTNELS